MEPATVQTVMLVLTTTLGLCGVYVFIVFRRERILNRLRRGAERYAAGDLGFRLPVEGSGDLMQLADSLNRMAGQLDERLSHLASQRNELMAVLGSMDEGVIAIDADERVMSLNEAAIRMLDLDPAATIGKIMVEAVRNSALLDLVHDSMHDQAETGATELAILNKGRGQVATGNLLLLAHATALRDADGLRMGTLVVLQDVTQLRRLEAVRRDFVANVSHEVKTPVAAIKAAAETLDQILPQGDADVTRFLGMIVRQADRLNAVVDDLLNLARIEQEQDTKNIAFAPVSVVDVISPAVEACQSKARAKGIQVHVHCPEELVAEVNESLLGHAVQNLLDNAIKYSGENQKVELTVTAAAGEMEITVTDQGAGIAPEHLPRIFERFYRVDKARSRALGGTGLGLAIVKHVAQAHDGRVSVESTLGQGSRFRIHLPWRDEAVV